MSRQEERNDGDDLVKLTERGRTLTITKTGTLPTLERLIGEMANLEKEAAALERKKKEIIKLIEENKTLKARNYFLERENNTLKIERATDTTRSFDYRPNLYKESDASSSAVELRVMSRRHPAHEDDKYVVKVVTSSIFAALPALLGIGIWSACLLTDSKLWYDVDFKSPLKVPFYALGGIWCGIYCTMGLATYLAWYHLGGRRGLPYMGLGFFTVVISYTIAPILMVGHWYVPTMVVAGVLWFSSVSGIMAFARVSVLTGLMVLPCLMWTTFTAAMVFFPFHEKHFSSTS